jgi:predicted ATP-grasp superfamily ATP-dependent carboligase
MEESPVDVLLLDAQYRQALATMRAYASVGLRVGAVACQSEAWWAPSMKSRWCARAASVPDFTDDRDAYVDAVLAVVKEWSPRLVVPAHDGSIEALRSRRSEFEQHTALALASEQALDVAVSKRRTLALGADLGLPVPRMIEVGEHDDIAATLSEVGLPAVIKPVQSWVASHGAGTRLSTHVVRSVDEAKESLDEIVLAGGEALVQEWVPGRREAVSLFYAYHQFWARLAQASHRDWPVLGGVSVLCETIPLLPDITTGAERLVRAIDLEGCSMVEFRRDRYGRAVLMEVNPRLGGSVALALAAGVDLPGLELAWKLGQPLEPVSAYRPGRRLRWLSGDIWHLKCVFDDQDQPDAPTRWRAAARFAADFAHPRTSIDTFHRGDQRPGLAEMDRFVLRHAIGRLRGTRPARWIAALTQAD